MDSLWSPEWLSRVRVPPPGAKVYKAECCIIFDTPRSPGGLLVDLGSFLAFGADFARLNYAKTGNAVYLRITETKVEKPADGSGAAVGGAEDGPRKKPNRLAIGGEGGFDGGEDEWAASYAIVILPDGIELPYPDEDLPEQVKRSAAAVLASEGSERQQDLQAWVDEEERPVSKLAAGLQQAVPAPVVPPGGWRCASCDKTDNLWMNLSDGVIGCGRSMWDGSGGNNHAIEHAKATGHPLAVKLGTITPALDAVDVYCYDPSQEGMVEDPLLRQHLEHFGIDVARTVKSDKTLAEMALDSNQRLDFTRLTAAGKTLRPLFGPGLTGMHNLGNTCYLASVLQALFTTKPFVQRLYESIDLETAFQAAPADPNADLATQMVKLAHGLCSGRYATAPDPAGITPRAIKTILGRGHPEFSTARQQDALELYQHLLETLATGLKGLPRPRAPAAAAGGADSPGQAFYFGVEERVRCEASGMVRYVGRQENVLSLHIPLEAATNPSELAAYASRAAAAEAAGAKLLPEEMVRPRVPLAACLESWAAPESISDFFSSATRARGTAVKQARLSSFPDYLVMHMRKFVLEKGAGWVPKKLDVFIEVPDEIDLAALRGRGPQPEEAMLPEEPAGAGAAAAMDAAGPAGGPGARAAGPRPDEGIVAVLQEMGFPRIRCEKAAVRTGNAGAEAAMGWLFEHMEDADIDNPISPGGSAGGSGAGGAGAGPAPVDEGAVDMLAGMGFDRETSARALRHSGGSVEAAAEMLLTMSVPPDDPAPAPAAPAAGAGGAAAGAAGPLTDGGSRYRLLGFVSHMGASTQSGHYVAHLRKGDSWVLFNDNKVAALDEPPPIDMGYLYFWERVTPA